MFRDTAAELQIATNPFHTALAATIGPGDAPSRLLSATITAIAFQRLTSDAMGATTVCQGIADMHSPEESIPTARSSHPPFRFSMRQLLVYVFSMCLLMGAVNLVMQMVAVLTRQGHEARMESQIAQLCYALRCARITPIMGSSHRPTSPTKMERQCTVGACSCCRTWARKPCTTLTTSRSRGTGRITHCSPARCPISIVRRLNLSQTISPTWWPSWAPARRFQMMRVPA